MRTSTLPLLFLLLLSSPLVLQGAQAANILVVAFFSIKSHKITYVPLLEELGKRGHNVTVISPIKASNQVENVNEIVTFDWDVIGESYMADHGFNPMKAKENKKRGNPFMMLDFFGDICRMTYDLPLIQQILKDKFDLVILQPLYNDCALGLVHRLGAPLVLFSPFGVAPGFLLEKLGGHLPPSFIPNIFLGYREDVTFGQRFVNFGLNVYFEAVLRFYYEPAMTSIYREKLGEDIPPVREILKNTSLLLSNGHFSLTRPIPLLPDVVEVGGLHSFADTKPLPKDLEDFIRKGNNGFIFFSMGSALSSATMTEAKRKLLLNVFSKLEQQVLLKWEKETMPDLPRNVKLSKWLPQQDLLAHKDIKMFITHCGGGSTEEAIFHGVPMIGIPMFADQSINAKLVEKHDMLIELDWNELTEESLMGGIQEILQNPRYRSNALALSTLFKDRPGKPMDTAVYWIEYILRHEGAPHLRSAGRKLNWFQYHSYDVILVYLSIGGVSLYLIFAILRWIIIRTCCRSTNSVQGEKMKPKRE